MTFKNKLLLLGFPVAPKFEHQKGLYTNEVPGLELRDKLNVFISAASWINNSILNTTFYVFGMALRLSLVMDINCSKLA